MSNPLEAATTLTSSGQEGWLCWIGKTCLSGLASHGYPLEVATTLTTRTGRLALLGRKNRFLILHTEYLASTRRGCSSISIFRHQGTEVSLCGLYHMNTWSLGL